MNPTQYIHPGQGTLGLTYDFFGKTESKPISIDEDNDLIFIGSPWEDDNGEISGKVYVYNRSDGVLKHTLTGGPSFGICTFAFGGMLVVGEHLAASAHVYQISDFTKIDTLVSIDPNSHFGWSCVITTLSKTYAEFDTDVLFSPIAILIGAPEENALYYFDENLVQKFKYEPGVTVAYNEGVTYDQAEIAKFGWSIGYTNFTLYVGAPGSYSGDGAVFRFEIDIDGVYYDNLAMTNVYCYQTPTTLQSTVTKPWGYGYRVSSKVIAAGYSYGFMATAMSSNGAETSSLKYVVANENFSNKQVIADMDGNLLHTSGIYASQHDWRYAQSGKTPDGNTIVFYEFGSRIYAKKYDPDLGRMGIGVSGYVNNSFVSGLAYDDVNHLIFGVGSYLSISHVYISGTTQYYSTRKSATYWSPGAWDRIAVCPKYARGYLGNDRTSRPPKVMHYNNPYSPTSGATLAEGGRVYDMVVDQAREILFMYAADQTVGNIVSVFAFDINADPDQPPLIGTIQNGGGFSTDIAYHTSSEVKIALDTVNHRLYIPTVSNVSFDDVYIIDVSDATAMTQVGKCTTTYGGHCEAVAYEDDKCYMAISGEGIITFDVTDPAATFYLNQADYGNEGWSSIAIGENVSKTYGSAIWDEYASIAYFPDEDGSRIGQDHDGSLPSWYAPIPYRDNAWKSVYENDERIGSYYYTQPGMGKINYIKQLGGNTGNFTDVDGTGYSIATSLNYLAYSSKVTEGYDDYPIVVMQNHSEVTVFYVYEDCDPACGLLRIYSTPSFNNINLVKELVTFKNGRVGWHEPNYDGTGVLLVAHRKGEIKVHGTVNVGPEAYGGTTPSGDYTVGCDVQIDGVPVNRQVLLFDKMTGQYDYYIDTDPAGTNEFLRTTADLVFIIAFDPTEQLDPVGIDDILPVPPSDIGGGGPLPP